MKISISILTLFLCFNLFSQIDSMSVNTLYMHSESKALRTQDSVNNYNGYPRQNCDNYILAAYDSSVSMYGIILNRVTEKYLKIQIMDGYAFPTVKIPIANLTESAETKLNDEIYTNNWNAYIKNNNVWIFNFNSNAGDTFTTNQRNYIISIGGSIYNF